VNWNPDGSFTIMFWKDRYDNSIQPVTVKLD
jgi:hypothetical protein